REYPLYRYTTLFRSLERRPPGQQMEQHAAERIDIRPMVDLRQPAALLGRHVHRRPHQHPGARLQLVRMLVGQLRDPEIEDLAARSGEHTSELQSLTN